MCNSSFLPSSKQKGGVRKTLLCAATASALSLMGGVANASLESFDDAEGFSLVRHTTNSIMDHYAGIVVADPSKPVNDEGALYATLTKSTVEGIRKVQGFENFGKNMSDKDTWTNVQAILAHSGSKTTWKNADIKIDVADDVEMFNFDAMGINNIGGTIDLIGDVTNISVTQNARPGVDVGDLSAVGYSAIDSIADKKSPIVTNFKAAKTSFDVVNRLEGMDAAGIISAANMISCPQVNVDGDMDVKVKAAKKGRAIGVYNIYSDWNLGDNPSIENPGDMAFKKNLTINVEGGSSAFGLSAEIGEVTVDGNTYVTAKVTDAATDEKEASRPAPGAYGIYVTSNGHLTLKGDETVVTADKALYLTKHATIIDTDYETETGFEEWVPQTLNSSVSLLSKETTLNGETFTEAGTTLYVANAVTFNGDADIEGRLIANSDAALKIGEDRTLTLGASQASGDEVKKNSFKNLTVAGGTLKNASQIAVDGELYLDGVTVLNESLESGPQAEISADKIVLGNGTTVINKGHFIAEHTVLGEGSLLLEEEKSWLQNDGTLTAQLDGITELAGGRISTIESDGQASLKGLELVDLPDGKTNPTLIVSQGKYAFDSVLVNLTNEEPGSEACLQVTGGELQVKDLDAVRGSAFVADQGKLLVMNLVSTGAFEMDAQGSFDVTTFKGADGGDFKLTGGTMNVTAINLAAGKLTIGGSATLVTDSSQIFANALDVDGMVVNAEALKYKELVFEKDSALTLTDSKYNRYYAEHAKLLSGVGKLEFGKNSTLVDINGETLPDIGIDEAPEGVTLGGTNLTVKPDEDGTVTVDKSVGGKTLVVEGSSKVEVSKDKTLTLAGSDASGELINFGADGKNASVTVSENAGIVLGFEDEGANTTGKISAEVKLKNSATLKAQNGAFALKDVKADSAGIAVSKGTLTVEKLSLTGTSTISAEEKAVAKLNELAVGKGGTTTVTGAVTADKIVALDEGNATINIGKTGEDGERGDLTIGEGSIKGLTFFLDPTWVDGQEVTEASRLVLNQTTLDGNVVVGENSYVVLGSTDDAAFVNLFSDGSLKWGDGEGETLAAAYAAKPISITDGYLVVDGSLKTLPTTDLPTAGSVKFGANTVFVADLTDADADTPMITKGENGTYTIDSTSKAVVVGDIKNGVSYKLTDDADADYWNTADTLVSGNPLWGFELNDDGSFTANLKDAGVVFGDLLQGHEIANAGMTSDDAGVRSYVGKLLTDELDNVQHAVLAARFDAAMNTAGAAAVFTTAYDRASELRDAVRGEALEGEGNRLWAQVTGGKTKLNGLSSGAQSIHVDTDAYGLVVGGDVALSNGVLGAAFTAGTGDSENDDVGVKDDFDFYGLSVYGKTSVGGIDLLADGSMTFVKSDLTMGGVADVDTDTTTAVYSLGVQAQRTWDYVVAITPFVGMDIYHVRGDGYDNGHGAQVDDAHATAVEFPIGATIAKSFETNGFKLSPNFSFAVVPTVGDRDIDSKVRFAGAQSTYNFTFADDVKVRTNLGFAAEKDNFRFGLNAGYDWGNEERSATKLMLNAQYRF